MKKLLALILVIVIAVFCFTACGDPVEDDGNNGNNGNNNGGTGEFGDGLFSESGLPAIPVEPDALS